MSTGGKLHDKLDRIEQTLATMNVTLAVNTEQLKEHMRRTQLLEQKLEPVEKHVARVDGIIKFLGVVGVIVGIVAGVIKIAG